MKEMIDSSARFSPISNYLYIAFVCSFIPNAAFTLTHQNSIFCALKCNGQETISLLLSLKHLSAGA